MRCYQQNQYIWIFYYYYFYEIPYDYAPHELSSFKAWEEELKHFKQYNGLPAQHIHQQLLYLLLHTIDDARWVIV